ncbi:MAG: hypothetical protein ACTSSH_00150 [Candidatus Heimdallarchaeota archaeon]
MGEENLTFNNKYMGIILIIVLILIAYKIDNYMEAMKWKDISSDYDYEGITDADEMQAIYDAKHNIDN